MLVADHEKIFLVWLIAITIAIVRSLIPADFRVMRALDRLRSLHIQVESHRDGVG
jgi:hypothetical protein